MGSGLCERGGHREQCVQGGNGKQCVRERGHWVAAWKAVYVRNCRAWGAVCVGGGMRSGMFEMGAMGAFCVREGYIETCLCMREVGTMWRKGVYKAVFMRERRYEKQGV